MPTRKQSERAALQLRLDQLLIEDALLLRDITEGRDGIDFEITGYFHRSSLARMRNGCNSNLILRGDVLLIALRASGAPQADAERVVAHWGSVARELYAHDLPSFEAAAIAEQSSDGDEDWVGTQAALDREKHTDTWIRELERYVGDAMTMLTVLRRDKAQRAQLSRAA